MTNILVLISAVILSRGVDAPPTGVSVGIHITSVANPKGASTREAFLAATKQAKTHVSGVLYDGSTLSVLVVMHNAGPADSQLDTRMVGRWLIEAWRGERKLASRALGPSHVVEAGGETQHPRRLVGQAGIETFKVEDTANWIVTFGPVEQYPAGNPIEIRLNRGTENPASGPGGLDVIADRQAFVRFVASTDTERVERLMQLATERRAPWRWEPDASEPFLREAIAIAPDDWELYLALATVLSDQSKTVEATNVLQSVADRIPHSDIRTAVELRLQQFREPSQTRRLEAGWPK